MLSCESSQTLIADGLYERSAATGNRQLREHLQSCPQCRQVMHEMQLAKMELESRGIGSDCYDDIPERSKLDDLWQSLQPDLDRIDAERYRESHRHGRQHGLPAWGSTLAIAAAVILIFSVVLVSINRPRTAAPEVTTAQQPVYQVDPELMQYLNRAQTMLMLVANTDLQNASVVPLRQSFARNMAQEANFLTAAREESFSSGQSRLLKDIEYLLLQIANLDDSNMEEGVALMQRFMEKNSILFRIRLVEMREQDPVI